MSEARTGRIRYANRLKQKSVIADGRPEEKLMSNMNQSGGEKREISQEKTFS